VLANQIVAANVLEDISARFIEQAIREVLNVSSQPTSLRRSILTLVFTVTFAVPGIIHAGSDDSHGPSAVDIDNFGRVNANYYRGGEPAPADYADLAALGIRTVIDLRSDDGNPQAKRMAEQSGMQYVAIPMDTHRPPTPEEIDRFLGTVTRAEHQPVYVHCVGGRHRTGVMTAVYRMTEDRWTADQAFKEMKRYKYGADFLHPEFKRFVYGFTPVVSVGLATH
jgi:uncharacterized protein (TIGR01244 family)